MVAGGQWVGGGGACAEKRTYLFYVAAAQDIKFMSWVTALDLVLYPSINTFLQPCLYTGDVTSFLQTYLGWFHLKSMFLLLIFCMRFKFS